MGAPPANEPNDDADDDTPPDAKKLVVVDMGAEKVVVKPKVSTAAERN